MYLALIYLFQERINWAHCLSAAQNAETGKKILVTIDNIYMWKMWCFGVGGVRGLTWHEEEVLTNT